MILWKHTLAHKVKCWSAKVIQNFLYYNSLLAISDNSLLSPRVRFTCSVV